jgi:hypothetical protein
MEYVVSLRIAGLLSIDENKGQKEKWTPNTRRSSKQALLPFLAITISHAFAVCVCLFIVRVAMRYTCLIGFFLFAFFFFLSLWFQNSFYRLGFFRRATSKVSRR